LAELWSGWRKNIPLSLALALAHLVPEVKAGEEWRAHEIPPEEKAKQSNQRAHSSDGEKK
jgi:hypothetical protein